MCFVNPLALSSGQKGKHEMSCLMISVILARQLLFHDSCQSTTCIKPKSEIFHFYPQGFHFHFFLVHDLGSGSSYFKINAKGGNNSKTPAFPLLTDGNQAVNVPIHEERSLLALCPPMSRKTLLKLPNTVMGVPLDRPITMK